MIGEKAKREEIHICDHEDINSLTTNLDGFKEDIIVIIHSVIVI